MVVYTIVGLKSVKCIILKLTFNALGMYLKNMYFVPSRSQ